MEAGTVMSEKRKPKKISKEFIYLDPRRLSILCKIIAEFFYAKAKREKNIIDVVVGPHIIASWVAYWLSDLFSKDGSRQGVFAVPVFEEDILSERTVRTNSNSGIVELENVSGKVYIDFGGGYGTTVSCFEKSGKRIAIKPEHKSHIKHRSCLVVWDVLRSEEDIAKVCKAVEEAGGEVFGIGAICNENQEKINAETFGVPLHCSVNGK